MKSKARWTAVIAAATAAICLTGSAAASSNPSPGGKPTTSASVDGAKSAKAKAVAAAKANGKDHGKGKGKGKGQPVEDQARLVEAFAKGISARLGVSPASARRAVKELFALADRRGGVDPRSPEFAAIAKRLGVTPGQFDKALSATKQAIGKQQSPGKPGEGKDNGKRKPGRDKPVIKHQGPDRPGDVRSVALGVAHRLGVSTASAERAVKDLFALSDRPGGVDAGSAEFAAIAKRLGITPGQFEKALSATKQAAIAKEQSLKG
ncbi:hypothetical protein ABZ153_04970 [Streptomyces sp. NPDC006290]|uniref:hypothetical protein n=1 Tax=Streptomyces sp. NPDC006290 TaxID=3156745 RepID=UPI0033A619FF